MRFAELFAGAGGLGRGLEAARMKHSISFEIGDAAHDVLVNTGKQVHKTDLNDVANTAFLITGRPDIIVGGPPCQDFSKAGSREEKTNARLTPIYAMTIAVLRPQWFVFENVDRAPYYRSYQQARSTWKRAGYGLTEVYIDCSHYGVPQRRIRFLCIGRLGERDGFLESAIRDAASPSPMTVRDMLNPRRHPEDRELLDKGYFWARPWSGKSGEMGGRGVRSIDEACPTIIRTTHEAPGPSYVAHREDGIEAKYAHRLSLNQVARIQGFPSGFDFRRKAFRYSRDGWSGRDVAQMIANAVPSPTAEIIGRVILARNNGDGDDIPAMRDGFADFLRKPNPKTGRKGLKSKASIANVLSSVNRARRLLGGKTFASAAEELAALERTSPFSFLPIEAQRKGANVKDFTKGTLGVKSKSDLRVALRLYREFEDGLPPGKFAELAARFDVRGLRGETLFPRIRTKPTKKKAPAPTGGVIPKISGREPDDLDLSKPMPPDDIDRYFHLERDRPDLHPEDFNDEFLRSDDRQD
ncbi:DNA cytosine methyltransferase [Rhizobium ruizarguesonis]